MRDQGIDVVDFGAGEPDFPTPENIKQAGIRAIESNFTRNTRHRGHSGSARRRSSRATRGLSVRTTTLRSAWSTLAASTRSSTPSRRSSMKATTSSFRRHTGCRSPILRAMPAAEPYLSDTAEDEGFRLTAQTAGAVAHAEDPADHCQFAKQSQRRGHR